MKVFIRYFWHGRYVMEPCAPVGPSMFECPRCKRTIFVKIDKICRGCAADVVVQE